MFQEHSWSVSEGFKFFFYKNVLNKLKYMDCNVKTLCKTSMMLMTMSKNPALLQKVLEDDKILQDRTPLET